MLIRKWENATEHEKERKCAREIEGEQYIRIADT
jgi:hypothetical protein